MASLQLITASFLLLLINHTKHSFSVHFLFNATVALDGTGNFKSINEAVQSAPPHSSTRFYIHIRAGIYKEYVEVPQNRTMIAFIGDGANVTIITGNRSPRTGPYDTHNSSTVAISGNGFMAQHITIENSAGRGNGQAVALSTTSDRSVYYKCIFLGYQDTLYAGVGNHFYKQCDIHGTVDFIFGNAAAVFQDCNLYARANGSITFTAHGRSHVDDQTGFSIQNCNFGTSPEVETQGVEAYFGRPWRKYATTIIMQSNISNIIDPSGWQGWNVSVDEVVYWEYGNVGPGSNTKGRVNWPGHKIITNPSELEGYTVAKLIKGDTWLPETKIPYRSGLA